MSGLFMPKPRLSMTTQQAVAAGAVMFGELTIGKQFVQLDRNRCECGEPIVWIKDSDRTCYTDHWVPLRGLEHSWDGDIRAASLVLPLNR